MSKHTPGPWRYKIVDSRTCWAEVETEPNASGVHELVAVVVTLSSGDDLTAELHNARLIAAAPNLLAACEALLRFAESVRPGGGVLAGEREMFEASRAAIAKAGGAA